MKKLLTSALSKLGYVPKESAKKRTFAAAAENRLTNDWATFSFSADSQARWSLEKLRARSRDLRDNNEYASKFIRLLKSNVIGECGFTLKNKAKENDTVKGGKIVPGALDLFANKVIEESFWEWGKRENCTVTGKYSWVDVQNIVLETVAVDGEVLVRKIRGFNNPFKFALQIIEADFINESRNMKMPNGNWVRMGVELDQWEKPVAIWLRRGNPADSNYPQQTFLDDRIPIEEFTHLYLPRRVHQTRGIPWMVTVMNGMKMLGGYEESEAVASRVAAGKMAFLTQTTDGPGEYKGDPSGNGISMDCEPGHIEELPAGLDIKTVDWNHPNAAYQSFMKTRLRGIASGLGCSYNMLADDMESVNFSSGRLGLEEPREVYKGLQRWMSEHFCDEIFSEWLFVQLMTGKVALPVAKFDKFNQPTWRGRRWAYMQPVDDAKAAILRINSGLSTLTKELASQGIDRDEHLDEIADDYKAIEDRDLDLVEIFGIGEEMKAQADAGMVEPEAPENS